MRTTSRAGTASDMLKVIGLISDLFRTLEVFVSGLLFVSGKKRR
jgi:hypothetical protein